MSGSIFIKAVFASIDLFGVVGCGLFAVGAEPEPVAVAFSVMVVVIDSLQVFPAGRHTSVTVFTTVVNAGFPCVIAGLHLTALIKPAKEHMPFLVKGELGGACACVQSSEFHMVGASGPFNGFSVGL